MTPVRRIMILLLVLQAVATIFLWTLDDLNEISEDTFALFLAIDLMSFAIISYIYRKEKEMVMPNRAWILVGCVLNLILLFSSFFLIR
jgi:hypothetical protein